MAVAEAIERVTLAEMAQPVSPVKNPLRITTLA
jgi:hypothetical protein